MDEIEKVVPYFQPRNDGWSSIRCPFCGDSDTPDHTHFYIKCGKDPAEPLVFRCFKCNKKGRLTASVLKMIGVTNNAALDLLTSGKYNRFVQDEDTKIKFDNFGNIADGQTQIDYIEHRLGKGFTEADYNRFRLLWNIDNVKDFITNQSVQHSLPNNKESITFLTDDFCMMLTRTFEEGHGSWRKIKIRDKQGASFYTIESTIDLFTQEPIVINIAEGVFDILSVYKNFNDVKNSVFLAVLCSDYIPGLDYLIKKGIVGKNVQVRIYIDQGIDEKGLKESVKNYKWLFDSISIFKNAIKKDVGVKLDEIKLVKI